MKLSVYLILGRDDRDIFVLPLLLICHLTVLSPLFYIQLSYVAIKDDFCKNAPLFALLSCLFLFSFVSLSFCLQGRDTVQPLRSSLFLLLFCLHISFSSVLFSVSWLFTSRKTFDVKQIDRRDWSSTFKYSSKVEFEVMFTQSCFWLCCM